MSQREEDAGLVERVKREEREKMKVIFFYFCRETLFPEQGEVKEECRLKGKAGGDVHQP